MTEFKKATCPVCQVNHGMRTLREIPGKSFIKTGSVNYWEEAMEKFNPDHPFGVLMESKGRGGLDFIRYYGIDEDEEGFHPFMAQLLVMATAAWVKRGLIDRSVLDRALGEV